MILTLDWLDLGTGFRRNRTLSLRWICVCFFCFLIMCCLVSLARLARVPHPCVFLRNVPVRRRMADAWTQHAPAGLSRLEVGGAFNPKPITDKHLLEIYIYQTSQQMCQASVFKVNKLLVSIVSCSKCNIKCLCAGI